MDYRELLENKNWKIRRQQILERDSHRCSRCLNYFLLKGNCASTFNIEPRGEYLIIKVDHFDEEGVGLTGYFPYKYIESITFSIEDLKTFALYHITDEDKALCNIIGIFQSHDIKRNHQEFQKINISSETELKKIEWRYVKSLHVHHKYYQLNKLPWEYPDEALITLCWHCHEELHQDEDVKVYDEKFRLIKYYTPCSRCSGAGRFPGYNHVEAGICFRCSGAKYEELID